MKVHLSQPIQMKHETWALVYSNRDFDNANMLVDGFKRASGAFGINVQDPQYVECHHDRNPEDYINPIKNDIDPGFTLFVVVLLANAHTKPPIKAALDKMGIPSQFILSNTIKRAKGMSVWSNVLKQINAKSRLDLYRMNLPSLRKTMIVGTNIVNSGGKSILGLCSSHNQTISQYYSKVALHDLPRRETSDKDRLSKDEKETLVTEKRTKIMQEFIIEALDVYQKSNNGQFPEKIVIYRDGIGGPTL